MCVKNKQSHLHCASVKPPECWQAHLLSAFGSCAASYLPVSFLQTAFSPTSLPKLTPKHLFKTSFLQNRVLSTMDFHAFFSLRFLFIYLYIRLFILKSVLCSGKSFSGNLDWQTLCGCANCLAKVLQCRLISNCEVELASVL